MVRCIARVSLFLEPPPERPVLVVPDIHQDLGFFERAVHSAVAHGASLLFLGDYVDSADPLWRGPAALTALARALTELAGSHPGGCVFLAGNHDVMALRAARFRAGLLAAGEAEQVDKMDQAMPLVAAYSVLLEIWPNEFLLRWRLAKVVHGVLASHAGVARRFWPWTAAAEPVEQARVFVAEAQTAWTHWVLNNEESPLFEVGPARGGDDDAVAGPLWLDWNSEFVDDLPLPQVVGHTRGREPKRKDRSWCIDAGQHFVGLIDPDSGLRMLRV